MRIGIVTDIHDEVELLVEALAALKAEGVDRIVSLGDTTDFHGVRNRAWEVAHRLRDANVLGVWGNHDFGLCRDVPMGLIETPDAAALEYYATFQPKVSFADCHFSHVEPWLDPENPVDLWYFDGWPNSVEMLARSFAAVPHTAMFLGHFHKWMAGTPEQVLAWDGDRPLVFAPNERHLIVIGALFNGCYAVYDTDTRTLFPHRLP